MRSKPTPGHLTDGQIKQLKADIIRYTELTEPEEKEALKLNIFTRMHSFLLMQINAELKKLYPNDYKHLQSWRGVPLNSQEKDGFAWLCFCNGLEKWCANPWKYNFVYHFGKYACQQSTFNLNKKELSYLEFPSDKVTHLVDQKQTQLIRMGKTGPIGGMHTNVTEDKVIMWSAFKIYADRYLSPTRTWIYDIVHAAIGGSQKGLQVTQPKAVKEHELTVSPSRWRRIIEIVQEIMRKCGMKK